MAPTTPSIPPHSLAETVREARAAIPGSKPTSIRELARRAGISAAQLSRIEAGHVRKPGHEVLIALARSLDRNPLPLLILAGHLTIPEAQAQLTPLFRDGAELPQVWPETGAPSLAEVRRCLGDPTATRSEINWIAREVFLTEENDEVLWHEGHSLAAAPGEDAAAFRELIDLWRGAGDYRDRLLEFGRMLRRLADIEFETQSAVWKAETAAELQAAATHSKRNEAEA